MGKDSARELALIFVRHVADYSQKLAQPLKQLINGMGEMENRVRERTSINIGQVQDIMTDGGTKNMRNINMIGYFADGLLPVNIGSPALNKIFFGDDNGYSNMDKG